MSTRVRGLQGIRTISALIDNRRARTPAGALLELSAMANEKLLLQKELKRWTLRYAEIHKRLGELAAKEQKLLSLVQQDGSIAAPSPSAVPFGEGSRNLKVKEFSY